ncbi:unnamed protein product, partial [marine sediment metagenome]
IGLEGFRVLVNHKYLKDLPFILETPKNDEKDDLKNINLVKSLVAPGDGSLVQKSLVEGSNKCK